LPAKGKAEVLKLHYNAARIPRDAYRLMTAFDIVPPGRRLVIVRAFATHDAALVVDRKEWAYLTEYPGELDKGSFEFLLVPYNVVDALITGMGKPDWGEADGS